MLHRLRDGDDRREGVKADDDGGDVFIIQDN